MYSASCGIVRYFLYHESPNRGIILLMNELVKNQIHEAEITGYSSEGAGVCRLFGRAVFVPGAIPGETWKVRILKVGASAVYARGETLLSASPERTEPACPAFGRCGGCDLMHMSYAEELRFKLGRVNDALLRIGGLDFQMETINGSARIEGYRNKGIYAVAPGSEGPVVGFYASRSHQVVPLPLGRCLIQTPFSDRAALAVRDWMRARKISAYDEKTGKGLVRHVFTRTAFVTKEAMVCLVAAGGFGAATGSLVDALRTACPEVTGIVLCVNKTPGNTVLVGDFHTLWGSGVLTDQLAGFRFELSPAAFFQINPPQAQRLYDLATDYAAPEGTDTVLDLYCGAGTITLCLARRARRAIGAEVSPFAVENARENARRNNVANAEFILGDAGEAARELARRGLTPEAIVVDPPRKGLSAQVIEAVLAMAPRRLVYISCDPGTMARDLRLLAQGGYAPSAGEAFDLFPRCAHVEVCCLLEKGRD